MLFCLSTWFVLSSSILKKSVSSNSIDPSYDLCRDITAGPFKIPKGDIEIISLFEKLNKMGTSMIIATHDYNLILKLEGQVYKCEDGSIFEVKRKNN